MIRASLTALSLVVITGCSGAQQSSEPEDNQGALTNAGAPVTGGGKVSASDLAEARSLDNLKLYVEAPKLSADAESVVIDDGAFDGTRNTTYIVKDSDGRLFWTSMITSDSGGTSRMGQHGAAPPFQETRYFLLMNQKGIDWAIGAFKHVPSTRHSQILFYKTSRDFPNDVKELGTRTIDGVKRTVVHFNSSLFLVSDAGFKDECKTEGVRACQEAWLRVDNAEDPFDAHR